MSIRITSSGSFGELSQAALFCGVILGLAGLPGPGVGMGLPGTTSEARCSHLPSGGTGKVGTGQRDTPAAAGRGDADRNESGKF